MRQMNSPPSLSLIGLIPLFTRRSVARSMLRSIKSYSRYRTLQQNGATARSLGFVTQLNLSPRGASSIFKDNLILLSLGFLISRAFTSK